MTILLPGSARDPHVPTYVLVTARWPTATWFMLATPDASVFNE
ncbi:hypothetical protein [Silvimonas amylolytica]|nr:hypothetical protein [Silvimonas amylolytica]